MNGLDAYDSKINFAFDENFISNEYTVKLCLDYEVKKGNKVVKKEIIVALRGELYFVKFIINPKEDDVEPEVILGRSLLRLVDGIVDFVSRDQLLNFNFDDIPLLNGEELLSFVCKMGKSSRNKKRAMENLNLFYPDIRPSLSTGRHLTQEEAVKEALALRNSQKFALLKEEFLYTIGGIVNNPERLFSTFDGICHQTFRAARSDVLRTAENDSDDEE
nr:hypothetical protein [Tanacetum cinerariifolium]